MPTSFADQCKLAWRNVQKQVVKGGMTLNNLVKVTVYLLDRKYRFENSTIRQEVLGEISPAPTIIIAGIYKEKWLLGIEAITSK